ncbi:3-oxoacyl-[acyl-carrier-protein] reductase [Maricaulaceae bacterium EIL42A08]|nr:3-oxoacyl-[acyl-carrier-protein] reductase [Maricaulaceae bacterium EIL42A08]
MFDLTGKKALVTGATGGLGSEIARALHAAGAHVALSGTRVEKLEGLASELGERTAITPANLSDADAVDALPKQASEALSGLDILISNAGVTRDQLLMRMKDEDWETVIKVNLEAHYRLSKACLRGMMKQRWGRIVGITSVVGVTGNPGQTNYAASKAGMIGFSKALAQEVGARGVTVNCVAPGFIESPMTDELNDDQRNAILSRIPNGKLGTGANIAAACVYLSSEEAGYVTGQTLHVNGGMAMI